MQRSWQWFQGIAKTKHAQFWLFVISFTEASVFPLITEVFLIPLLAAKAGRWKYYAFLASLGSILGALFGYVLGMYVFDYIGQPVIDLYHLTEQFEHVGMLYAQSTFWAVLTAAVTPIPFKVFVLAGGFFSVPLLPFMIASVIGRSLRYIGVAWVAHTFGPRVAERYLANFNFYTIVLLIFIAMFLILYFDIPELF